MNKVITALDFKDLAQTMEFLAKFPKPIFVKVGMELFYAAGPKCIEEIKAQGHQIFLDLKFHDIPNTVAGAVRSCAKLGVDIINLHAAGGSEMMQRAVTALKDSNSQAKLIAITQLTSISEKQLHDELWLKESMTDTVLHYAKLAKQSGLDGVVCSALESKTIHQVLGRDFLTVTPGIRPLSSDVGDQKRIVTPEQAANMGSDYIVVGRPITKSFNPVQAYQEISKAFNSSK